ncbi:MAG TPA: glycosyltransferase family 2 protein [Chloroflexota bacterium]|nr:glycosyltransferase family 2 protein [Chloroflexota bacterium]
MQQLVASKNTRYTKHASERVIHGKQALEYVALVCLWVIANAAFWLWWTRPERVASGLLYVPFTVAYGYIVTGLPAMYLFYVGRMRRPKPAPVVPGRKVALITLCVPSSESIEVIEAQLRALAGVTYPHDSWVLDEGGDPRVQALATRLNVRYFTRHGIDRYNQPVPPFKAKTKAGNVNAWLDAHGHQYTLFVQFDIDHRPRPDYLDRVVGYFEDEGVAWVQAPSLYGNLDNWVARGAAEQELVLQGPLQQGFYGASDTPFIIGSHTTYRTSAVQQIGGFQPTRAEDHLDTVALATKGYRGVFLPEQIATGNGPETFETYLRQQFAWAASMMEVLFFYTPKQLRRFRPMQALQFLFAETWYTCWSTSVVFLFLLPLISLLTGARPSTASLLMFVVMTTPLNFVTLVIWLWTRKWQLPAGLRLSWRGIVLHVSRWPIVTWALINVLLRVKHPYMITPKGQSGGLPRFSLRSHAVYLSAVWLTAGVVFTRLMPRLEAASSEVPAGIHEQRIAETGFSLLALWGAAFLLAVYAANVVADIHELRLRACHGLTLLKLRWQPLSVLIGTLVFFAAAAMPPIYVGVDTLKRNAAVLPLVSTRLSSAAPFVEVKTPSAFAPAVMTLPVPASPAPEPILPMDLPQDGVSVGAYDPWHALPMDDLQLAHVYIRQDEPELLRRAMAFARNRYVLLATIEPFTTPTKSAPVLDLTVDGQRDEELRALAKVVRENQPQVVLVRWGHEMDLSGLYPWAANEPQLYRQAFRHVVDTFRAEGADNARFVWSPAGSPQALDYYPGSDVVDYVGLTILGDAGWDANFGLPPQSFSDLLAPKYSQVVHLQKPIVIAELGVSGTRQRQISWLQDAASSLAGFPAVRALAYFNAVNQPNNHLPTEPDWTVPSSVLDTFVADVRQQP